MLYVLGELGVTIAVARVLCVTGILVKLHNLVRFLEGCCSTMIALVASSNRDRGAGAKGLTSCLD